ncbi:MAG: sodium:solute symporter [Ignavibacteria bacterium]|nr:sodium:solute symporter [Ignavibacteria bacterium]
MGFTTLDYGIVLAYLVLVAAVGILSGGRQQSTTDYFLGRRNIPWVAVCLAIVATETSTLTFISIPGLAYATNLNFLQVTFGYLIGRIIISVILLPAYAKGELSTAYQLLGNRFGPTMQRTTSIAFMVTRILADGVRLFATAIPLALLLAGWQQFSDVPPEQIYVVAILILAAITITYTYVGGVRAVIWTDVVQLFMYIGGAIGSIIVILSALPEGAVLFPPEKMSVFNPGIGLSFRDFFGTAYTLPAGLLGGAFLSMASHGTDHIIVQRLLTVRTLRGSQKALIWSGVIVIFQFALFLLLGILLFSFYREFAGVTSIDGLGLAKADELFPKFIIEQIPSGLSGLIVAGLLAAAMSTLSGSVNSLASATINDLYIPNSRRFRVNELTLSRIVSLFWCLLLVGVAIFFISYHTGFLVELALSIASVTYGALLGVFMLGVLTTAARERDAMIGFGAGLLLMIGFFLFGELAWTWYTLVGSVTAFAVGWMSALVNRPAVPPGGRS